MCDEFIIQHCCVLFNLHQVYGNARHLSIIWPSFSCWRVCSSLHASSVRVMEG